MESFTLFGPSDSGWGRSNFIIKVKWALTRKREGRTPGRGHPAEKKQGDSKAVLKVKNGGREGGRGG